MKLNNEQKALALQLYDDGVSVGLTSREICESINEQLGLDLDESTYRKAYYAFKEIEISDPTIGDELYQTRLVNLTKRDIRQREERKRLIRERALVEEQIREYIDKSAVKEAIVQLWNANPEQIKPIKTTIAFNGKNLPIYAYGDVHWGYTINDGQLVYSKEIAAGRIDAIFEYIIKDAILNNYKEIYVLDLADDIEGAALRTSQLLRIVESMTVQARGYADYLIQKLRELATELSNVIVNFYHISEDNHSQLRLHNTSRDELPENLQELITSKLNTFVETAHSFNKLNNLIYKFAPEVLFSINGINIIAAHGHQYGKGATILEMASKRHETKVHMFIGGHWHQYSQKNKDVYHDIQECLIFLPAVVGDTDYSDRLFLSSKPGFVKLVLDLEDKYIKSELILFKKP